MDALLAEGISPRCGHRKRTNKIPLRRRKVPLVIADIDEPETLREAFADTDVVYHLAGHYPRHGRSPEETVARAVRELQTVLDAAAEAGVRRLIYVSSTATVAKRSDGLPSTEADVFPVDPGFGAYHSAKVAMERLALDEQRFEVVVACPGACLGPWDLRVGTSALLVGAANGIDIPHPDGWVSPIDVRDLGRALVRLGRIEAPPRRILLAGESLRLQDLLELLAERYGTDRPSAPLADADAIAFADAEEARVEGTAYRAALAREIADLVVHGAQIDAQLGATLLPDGLTPLAETLDAFDAFARRMRLIPSPPTAEDTSAAHTGAIP
ncbi:MAG: NAD-dependent epimerase/dehydratase family protein [Deltaproteobacteria bacterium]|nr:MAG: NAD-dependent epimerase/dehydratase family protein [Deltaproteobacteria bacterium]